MKLDIDLNKLDINELESLVALAKRYKAIDVADDAAKKQSKKIAQAELSYGDDDEPIRVKKTQYTSRKKLPLTSKANIKAIVAYFKSVGGCSVRKAFKMALKTTRKMPNRTYGKVRDECKRQGIDYKKLYSENNTHEKTKRQKNSKFGLLCKTYTKELIATKQLNLSSGGSVRQYLSKMLKLYDGDYLVLEGAIKTIIEKDTKPLESHAYKYDMFNESQQKLFESITKNVANQSLKLTYPIEGRILDLTPLEWDRFVEWFMAHSRDISAYLGAYNLFKFINVDGRKEIKYN